jgi:GTPase involved in cell partitioning and DNA repair
MLKCGPCFPSNIRNTSKPPLAKTVLARSAQGANGDDRYIEVPLGTIAKDEETGEVLFEITENGEEHILVKGGRGGLGNVHFKELNLSDTTFCPTRRGSC